MVIRFSVRADLRGIKQYISGGKAEARLEALQVLDIVLRELPTAGTRRMADPSSRRTWSGGGL